MKYYYGGNNTGVAPPIGNLTLVPSAFSDGLPGDTNTFVGASRSGSVASWPLILTDYAFAVLDLEGAVTLSGYSITTCFGLTPPVASVHQDGSVIVEYTADSTDGADGRWTTLGTHAINASGGGNLNFGTINNSFAPITARMLRLRMTADIIVAVYTGTLSIYLSDFRITLPSVLQAVGSFAFSGFASISPMASGKMLFSGSASYQQGVPDSLMVTLTTDCQDDVDILTWTAPRSFPALIGYAVYLDYVAPQNLLYQGPLQSFARRRLERQESRLYIVVAQNALGDSLPAYAASSRCDPVNPSLTDGWNRNTPVPTPGTWH